MSRTLKRVPMDFDAPLDQVWPGYLNPHRGKATKCPHCDGGWSDDYKRMEALWYSHKGGGFHPEMRGSDPYTPGDELVKRIVMQKVNRNPEAYGIDAGAVHREAVRMCEIWNSAWSHHLNEQDVAALLEKGRLMDFTHHWVDRQGWRPKDPPYVPTPREVNDWSLQGFGHDATNRDIVLKAELDRLGLPAICDRCEGEGETWASPEDRKACEEWRAVEPPTGEGYQLWETTSEGSPISPVFATLEELCQWCETGATTFGTARATAQQWREMLDENFVYHREGNAIFM